MKNNYLSILLIVCFSTASVFVQAQYKAVFFDYEKLVFGENQPLPSESHIMLQSPVSANIGIVELDILEPKGNEKRLPLYTSRWARNPQNNQERFMLPINFKLKSSAAYDLRLKYYTPIGEQEINQVGQSLVEYINTYLDQVIIVRKNSLSLEQNERQIIRSLDKVVHKGLKLYRNKTNTDFEGFSDLIRLKLRQISSASLSKGKLFFKEEKNSDAKVSYRNKLLQELRTMIRTELQQYLNLSWFKLVDSKYIDDYATEKGKRTIAIQAGFGGAYLSGTTSNLAIGAAPFIGFAFPLSKRSSKSKVLNNLAINFGLFILDFQDNNGNVVSGPIFRRPSYIGLSYKLFRFIHVNAGATFLEAGNTAGQISGLENRVYIRPYIGISAQIDLWIDFSK